MLRRNYAVDSRGAEYVPEHAPGARSHVLVIPVCALIGAACGGVTWLAGWALRTAPGLSTVRPASGMVIVAIILGAYMAGFFGAVYIAYLNRQRLRRAVIAFLAVWGLAGIIACAAYASQLYRSFGTAYGNPAQNQSQSQCSQTLERIQDIGCNP